MQAKIKRTGLGLILLVLGVAACKKEAPTTKPGAATAQISEPASKNSEAADSGAGPAKQPQGAPPTAPASDTKDKLPKTLEAPSPSAHETPKSAQPKTQAKAIDSTADTRQVRTVCVRACNKAQICGKAGGSGAAECMQKCLALKDETNEGAVRTLESFRAQEACADVSCEDFEPCVQREIAQRRQLTPIPAYSAEKAEPTCAALCEHEQKCKPEIFVQLRKSMEMCKRYCGAVLVGTDNGSSAARTIMGEAIRCLGKSCDAFEACIQTAP